MVIITGLLAVGFFLAGILELKKPSFSTIFLFVFGLAFAYVTISTLTGSTILPGYTR